MEQLNEYIKQHEERFLNELFDLIRIPSVSSLEKHKPDIQRAAEYWKKILLEAGADHATIYPTPGNPVVYAERIIDPSKSTILVYAHMDVMPADPIEKWVSDPFEPVIRDGKIWARGANDDKGQSFIHAKAFEYLVRSNHFYEKYRAWAFIMGRFIPIIRTFLPILAGASAIHFKRFLLYDTLGAIIWVSCIVSIGYFFGKEFPEVIDYSVYILLGIVIIASLLILKLVVHKK